MKDTRKREKGTNKNIRLSFRKGDLLAIGFVILLAAGLLLGYLPAGRSAEQAVVQVFQDGELIRELALDSLEEQIFTISGKYINQVTIRNGEAAITESNCPGTDCVYSGWISRPGRSIVCLPNRMEIRITGASDVDFVVR